MAITELIYKTLTTKVAPMVYIMMFVNVLIGFFFATGIFMGPTSSILFGVGVLVHRYLWGALLVVTSTSALYGMARGNTKMTAFGGIAGFMLWLFAAASLALNGYWYVFLTTAVFHMLFHGYVYLASTANVLHRRF